MLVTGLAVVLKKGMGRGQWAGRPLLIRIDPRPEMAVECRQRPEQADREDPQSEGPGDPPAAENARLADDPTGRHTRRVLSFCGLCRREVDQDSPAVAGRQVKDMIAEGQARRLADGDIGPGDEPSIDTERLASGRDHADPARPGYRQGGVMQADGQVGQADFAVGTATDARRLGRQDLLANDLGPADAACDLAKNKGHRAITSR